MSRDATPHRSEGRFYIKSDATRVTVTCTHPDGQSQTFVGQLVDLSLRGVRVDIDGRLESGQQIDLTIEVPSESLTFHCQGRVRWQQPRATKTWWTGCELSEPFDEKSIERLAAAHVLNRRRDPRHNVDKLARVRTELSHETHDVRLVNYSKGGFCLMFQQPVEFPHERLMLVIDLHGEELAIPARVMWSGPAREAFAVGCAFSNVDGFRHVRDFAEPERSRRGIRTHAQKISSWIALSLVLMIVLQTSWLLQARPELSGALRDHWATWIVEPFREHFLSSDVEAPAPDGKLAG